MTVSETHARRAKLLSVLLLVSVFISGALAGAVLAGSAFADEAPVLEEADAPPGLSDLGLDAEQEATIGEIMSRYQPAVDSVVGESMRRIQELVGSVDSEVRGVLTPAQASQYDEMRAGTMRIRAVRRTMDPDGNVTIDTIGGVN